MISGLDCSLSQCQADEGHHFSTLFVVELELITGWFIDMALK